MTDQAEPQGGAVSPLKIEFLNDVSLELTVELGRVEASIRDFLRYRVGSIIELSKRHGEPLDIIANSKLIAKGEVVVVNDNFGIRVTQIETPDSDVTP